MTRYWRMGILAAALSCWAIPGNGAGPVTFDFESNSIGTFTPFTQTVGGVTASFSVQSGPGYSVQNQATTFFVLSQFSGNFLNPNLATVIPLRIVFSETADSITLRFATVEQHAASSMHLSAYLGAIQVGSATGAGAFIPGDTYPQGTVTFSGATFDRVELFVPLQGTEPAVAFLIDTVTVNTLGPPPPVLQANWHFEEGANQTATDSVGGHVGQLGSTPDVDANDPEWTPGRTGGGLTFSGSQYVAAPTAAALSPGTITVEAWVRSSFVPNVHEYLVAKGANDTCTAGAYGLRMGTTGGVEFVVFGPGGALVSPESDTSVWNGLWHFVTGTFDGTTARVFVDGVETGTGTSAGAAFAIDYTAPDQRLAIGSYLGGTCGPATLSYRGDIDQVGIWSGALSAAAIAQRFSDLNVPFPTETTLTAGPPGTAPEGEPVALTAYVASNNGAPTGSVEFFDGAASLGTAALVSGTAQVVVTSLALGAHTLSVSFTPDGLFEASTSAPMTYTVVPAGPSPTNTSLLIVPNPSVHTQPVVLTVTVTSSETPTGTVECFDGATLVASAALTGGVATFTRACLGAGAHAFRCDYIGNADFAPSSAAFSQTVLKADTATVLALSPLDLSRYTMTATVAMVAPAAGTTTGVVGFYDGATLLGTAALINGQVSFTTSPLDVGVHPLSVRYVGTPDANASASPPFTLTIDRVATTTSLESSDNPALLIRNNVGVRYTVTVSAAVPGAETPGGDVLFYDNGELIDKAKVHRGTTTILVKYRTPGTHTITAAYAGTDTFSGSASAPLTQVVQ